MLEIPENDIHQYEMDEYIKDRYKIENYNFLMITPYRIHTN